MGVGLEPGEQGLERLTAVVDDLALDQVDRLDLVRALVDHRDAAVAHDLLDAVVVHVAVATEDLQRIVGTSMAAVGEKGLDHGGQQADSACGDLSPALSG